MSPKKRESVVDPVATMVKQAREIARCLDEAVDLIRNCREYIDDPVKAGGDQGDHWRGELLEYTANWLQEVGAP